MKTARPQQGEKWIRGKLIYMKLTEKPWQSLMHTICSIFSPDCRFFLISSPLPQSFSPQPRNPSRSLPFIATEIHSTCPLIGILLFLYLCIPLFIQNHMLMKSVIINLKYLIFRSVSASEGGWLEEQQRRGEGVEGKEDGKSRAVASALSASAALKSAPTKAPSIAVFFHIGSIWSPVASYFLNTQRSTGPVHLYSFVFCRGWLQIRLQYRSLPLSPISKLHPQPQH